MDDQNISQQPTTAPASSPMPQPVAPVAPAEPIILSTPMPAEQPAAPVTPTAPAPTVANQPISEGGSNLPPLVDPMAGVAGGGGK